MSHGVGIDKTPYTVGGFEEPEHALKQMLHQEHPARGQIEDSSLKILTCAKFAALGNDPESFEARVKVLFLGVLGTTEEDIMLNVSFLLVIWDGCSESSRSLKSFAWKNRIRSLRSTLWTSQTCAKGSSLLTRTLC